MGLFGFGKSNELKQYEALQRQKKLELERLIVDALSEICVFPGSKGEFEDFIGYQTAWVDLGGRIKGLLFDDNAHNPFHLYKPDFQKRIVDSGVVALVNSNFTFNRAAYNSADTYYFGVPVKKE